MSFSTDALVREARALCGVPFCHQGRTPAGLDCLGLLMLAAHRADYRLGGLAPDAYDRRDYGARPDTEFLQAQLDAHLQRVDRMAFGDVLLLRIEGRAQHLALVSDYPAPNVHGMIHAYAVARQVVEHRLDGHWQRQIHAIYRLPH